MIIKKIRTVYKANFFCYYIDKVKFINSLIKKMAVEFHKNKQYFQNGQWTVGKVQEEIDHGLKLLQGISQPIVAFFGSSRHKTGSPLYDHAYRVAKTLSDKGFAIMTGGGPGIMHAANSGAMEAGGRSIGLRADLLEREKITDKIYTDTLNFHFFFARRFTLLIKTHALIYYPGGYGTLNEFLENLMLMQNSIVDRVPIICVNTEYWSGLASWLKERVKSNDLIDPPDLKLFTITNSIKETIDTVVRYS